MRKMLQVLMVLGALVSSAGALGDSGAACPEALVRASAVQHIEYLQRRYARATDQIGRHTPESIASGRATYHQIFAADARIRATGTEPRTGPDAWVELVADALGPMGPTQHLIGTQIVEIGALELDAQCRVVAGDANLQSYLQAWHTLDDERVWLFLGTYHARVAFNPEVGWQITEMVLERTVDETRWMDDAVGRAAP